LAALFSNLAATRTKGVAKIDEQLQLLTERISRRTVLTIFSDMMEEPDSWGPALCALSSRGIDIRLAHLFSEKEFGLEIDAISKLHGFEDDFQLSIEPNFVRPIFKEIVADYLKESKIWASNSRTIWVPTPYEKPLETSFIRLMRGV
jgi:hypothetical protein